MRAFIESRYEQFLRDLESVVNIDSGSGDASGLMAVAAFFKPRFEALGWSARLELLGEGGVPCLEIVNRKGKGAPSFDFLLLGHMDTVFRKGTAARRPFTIREGRAYGPGICDMKGGLVSVLHAAEALEQSGASRDMSICVAFNSDEEIGTRASRQWLEALATRTRRVFVFEPCRPSGHRVLERKGVGFFELICHGRSAHAGVEPEKGANAILELSHQVIRAAGLQRVDLGTTVNVTTISGGSAKNVIPDLARAAFDVRFSSAAEMERVRLGFSQLPQSVQLEGVRLEVNGNINRPPMVPSEATLKLWQAVLRIGERLGLSMSLARTGGGSDGNFTAAIGVPTIDAMGPRGGSVHTEAEYLELESVVSNIHFLCEIVAEGALGNLP